MKVYLDEKGETGVRTGKRKIVNAELVRKVGNRLLVRLEDGNVIKRKLNRDIPENSGLN